MSPVSDRQSYKSDLSDERRALIKPVVTSWKARHPSVSGHQGNYDMREIVNALLYQSRSPGPVASGTTSLTTCRPPAR